VGLTTTGANNVQLTNGGATLLAASGIGGNLTVTSGGALSQTGAVTVSGGTTFATTVAGSDILMNTQANDFGGAVSVGGTVTNVRDFALRNTDAGATVPVLNTLTSLRNLALQLDNAGMTLGAFSASGTASLTAGGTIAQSAAVTVN